MKYLGLALVSVLIVTLVVPLVAVAQQTETLPEEELSRETPVFEVGGWGKLKVGFLLNMSLDQVLELTYTIRNLTYDLFQWEIGYNVTAANVTLTRGDAFLAKAISLNETAPKRAVVYAFVASIHYSHAPALANSVLCKVIKANLGENGTITDQTVKAVNKTASELRELLISAIEYAESKGYNTTLAKELLEIGDERIANATSLLEEGNVTIAFRYAVSGYRFYVRAYHALVKSTYVQVIREIVGTLTSELVEYKEPPAKAVVNILPVQVRELVRAKIQRGEIQKIGEIVRELEKKANETKLQIRLVEKENLKKALIKIMEKVRERVGKAVNITTSDLENIVEEYYVKGYRGTELAKKVLDNLAEKVSEIREIVKIPQSPAKPPARK